MPTECSNNYDLLKDTEFVAIRFMFDVHLNPEILESINPDTGYQGSMPAFIDPRSGYVVCTILMRESFGVK